MPKKNFCIGNLTIWDQESPSWLAFLRYFSIYAGLNTDFKLGIYGDEEDKNERLQFYGTNQKPVKEPPTFFELLC